MPIVACLYITYCYMSHRLPDTVHSLLTYAETVVCVSINACKLLIVVYHSEIKSSMHTTLTNSSVTSQMSIIVIIIIVVSSSSNRGQIQINK